MRHKYIEYRTWEGMKQRCFNKNHTTYRWYGGRGILMCDRWRSSFLNFLEDMGPKPTAEHSIDRIDNNKGYYKENCKWATKAEQILNRSDTKIKGGKAKCSLCKEVKSVSDYYTGTWGIMARCKMCINQLGREKSYLRLYGRRLK